MKMFYACEELAALVMHDNFISVSHKCPVAVGCACAMNHQMHAKHSKCSYNISKDSDSRSLGHEFKIHGSQTSNHAYFHMFYYFMQYMECVSTFLPFCFSLACCKNVHSPNKKNITSQMCYLAV